MKVAINHYGRFECDSLGLFINDGDTFIVTPKIEKSKQYQTGFDRKKFEVIEVTDLSVVQKAVNVTPTILEKYRKTLTTDPEPEDPVPEVTVPDAVPDVPPAEANPPENEGEAEKTDEAPKEDGQSEDGGEAGKEEQDPVLPFTEAAGGIANAKVAIEKETDIEKLKFALEHDSRVTLKPVLEARIKELES